MARPDAIVVGAGHNGLVAALTLAKAGRSVLVLERSARIGGVCAEREFHKGFRAPGLLQDTSTFQPDLVEAFDLTAHGLVLRDTEPPVFTVDAAGGGFLLHADPAAAAEEIGRFSAADAAAYADWRAWLDTVGPVLHSLLSGPPPPLAPADLRELWSVGRNGLALRRLGRETLLEALRVLPMSVADWLQERFETEALCAALAAPGVLGTFNGPWAAGTAGQLILQEVRRSPSIVGGAAALASALCSAAKAAGVEIRTSARVEAIHVDRRSLAAVRLASGEEIPADLVVACCDPKQALLELVGARALEADVVHDLKRFRSRGTTAVLHLAVQGRVELAGHPDEPIEHLRLGGATLDDIERAFDAAKYRQRSTRPHLEIRIPSVSRPELAPDDSHVITALVSCAPYDLDGGWTPAVREALIADCVRMLNEQIPGLRERLVSGELLAPPDLEAEYALPGGHLHHGEHAPDQLLFMRPTRQLAQYATPVRGLFLGSSGCHPGGGITGQPGRLAATAAVEAET